MNTESNLNLTCDEESATSRLDAFISSKIPEMSRSKAQELIKSKKVLVNGKALKSSAALKAGDNISIEISASELSPEEIKLEQQDLDVEIVFEDEHVIVVNKPEGMVTHPGAGNSTGTLVHAFFDKLYKNDDIRPGVVHRLDKDTSGLLVLTKTKKAFDSLSAQFKEKTAKRIYWCLHFGRLKFQEGSVTTHLARHPKNRKKYSSQETGKLAKTYYKCVHAGPMSLTELSLETGRTHQIRVHLSEMGHPIFNDSIYGSPKNINGIMDPQLKSKLKSIKRLALVARKLSFTHPETNIQMDFETDWPEELDQPSKL